MSEAPELWTNWEDRVLREMIGAGCTLEDVSRALERPFWGVRSRYDRLVELGECQHTRKSVHAWSYREPSREVAVLIEIHKRSYARSFAESCEEGMRDGKFPLIELAFQPKPAESFETVDHLRPPEIQAGSAPLQDSCEFSACFFSFDER